MNADLWDQPIANQITVAVSQTGAALALARQTRDRIRQCEPDLRAWVALCDDLEAQAAAVDRYDTPRALSGVSVGVKDLIHVAGLPTRAGSSVTPAQPADTDADCVARLRALGAVIQGKTVTTEFGYFAPGPTRNPHALGHTPGGSSSGSAAAVGGGVIPLALGTQTAGSLTRPASFCGAAGMVLAHGATSTAGIVGLSESLDSLGLLTRTVDDMRLVYRAFTGPTGDTAQPTDTSAVFIWHGSELDDLAAPMRQLLQQLPQLVHQLGIECRRLDWDDHVRTLAVDHVTVMAREAANTRARELQHAGDLLSAPLRQLLEQGAQIGESDCRSALVRRDRSRDLLAALLAENGVVIGPAALGPAPAGLSVTGSPILSRPWQLLGLPVVVVPGAVTTTGLPLGLQIIGLPGREYQMLDLGVRLEALLRECSPVSVTTRELVP
ncbi:MULTISPECIES: amidase [unclassified Mycolicibacterium]|uniref:amidase n=1 Tax=unclassified Mycolicibacterium TaxID=2636767 RepID=UPI0013091E69|nr:MULTISPECIES: amidase [unclassified Mycolicibacterium]MUL83530.1 amidase [Mycolicibacterium sp. CBMA 329]MUL90521.1 amidase [Mycolicibacterium sp. CBMA 331]MUM00493.1 amidase [Mycolicibacterium sp. CBMA 334]MUM41465.1 amidase [Mycolicibacterium sp. CBMA 247]MUM45929.1 amidase [Mycolicibacterium sp. CBMA 294]